jgi:hypothetical protein
MVEVTVPRRRRIVAVVGGAGGDMIFFAVAVDAGIASNEDVVELRNLGFCHC